MKKILCVQFRIDPIAIKHEQCSILRETKSYVSVDFIDALDGSCGWDLPQNIMSSYDGVILGGSGELDFDGERDSEDQMRKLSGELLDRLRPFFKYIFDNDIPTLGICYGHQIFGAFAGAQVCCDRTQKKSRSHEVKLMIDKNDYFLFSDVPDTFYAHYGHKDVLDRVPEGAVLLMNGGEECKVSALQYKKNIYTVQFHPELSYNDMLERLKLSPDYLPEGVLAEEVFKDDANSNKILSNFGQFVAKRS